MTLNHLVPSLVNKMSSKTWKKLLWAVKEGNSKAVTSFSLFAYKTYVKDIYMFFTNSSIFD